MLKALSNSTLWWISGLLLVPIGSGLAQSPEPEPATISGIVTDIDGLPYEHVRLWLDDAQGDAAVTGPDGRYRIEVIAPGRHTLTAQAHYVRYTESLGRGLPPEARSVLVGSGSELQIDLELERLGMIRGTIFNANGDPAPNIQLTAAEPTYSGGTLGYFYLAQIRSDEQGNYQFAVPPRQSFVISVIPPYPARDEPVAGDPESTPRPTSYRPVFYPNSPTPDAATAIYVASGAVIEGINLRIEETETYCVTGRMDPANGSDERGVTLFRGQPQLDANTSRGGQIVTDEEGRFRRCGLPPGEYILARGPDLRFSIVDRDVEVNVPVAPAVAVQGTLAWDDASQTTTDPVEAELHIGLETIPVMIPGTFETAPMKLWKGLSAVEITLKGLPPGAYLAGTRYPGGASLALGMRRDGAILTARVIDRNGDSDGNGDDPAPGAYVLILPQQTATDADLAEAMQWVQADQAGQLPPTTLPPGDYTVLATRYRPNLSPDFVRALRRAMTAGEKVELGPGTTTEVQLEFIQIQ